MESYAIKVMQVVFKLTLYHNQTGANWKSLRVFEIATGVDFRDIYNLEIYDYCKLLIWLRVKQKCSEYLNPMNITDYTIKLVNT